MLSTIVIFAIQFLVAVSAFYGKKSLRLTIDEQQFLVKLIRYIANFEATIKFRTVFCLLSIEIVV